MAVKMVWKILRAKTGYDLATAQNLGRYIPISCSSIHFPCGSCILAKAHNLLMSRKQQRKWVQLSRLEECAVKIGVRLLGVSHDFQ